MISSANTNLVFYLIHFALTIYLGAVILRFLLQLVRADYYNQLSQFIIVITDPILKPLRIVLPQMFNQDTASLVITFLFAFVAAYFLIPGGYPMLWFVIGLGIIIQTLSQMYFFMILIIVIISWVNPYSFNPALSVLRSLTEPLLAPVRRVVPPIAGIDISPMLVMIALQLMEHFILGLLQRWLIAISVG